MNFDFLRPNDRKKLGEPPGPVNGVFNFFSCFFGHTKWHKGGKLTSAKWNLILSQKSLHLAISHPPESRQDPFFGPEKDTEFLP
jgi:hypothetical protein